MTPAASDGSGRSGQARRNRLIAWVWLSGLSSWLQTASCFAAGGLDTSALSPAIEWPAVPLLTADHKVVDLRTDVVQDRLVVMNFVYTRCTAACPVQFALFSRLQQRLDDRLDKGVRLISISIDPSTDTPERLKQTALRHQARPGWIWLTGAPPAVQAALRGLGVNPGDPSRHQPSTLIGDGRCDRWVRLSGFPAVDRILSELKDLEARRTPASGACR